MESQEFPQNQVGASSQEESGLPETVEQTPNHAPLPDEPENLSNPPIWNPFQGDSSSIPVVSFPEEPEEDETASQKPEVVQEEIVPGSSPISPEEPQTAFDDAASEESEPYYPNPDFMNRIPNIEEDYPQSQQEDSMPELGGSPQNEDPFEDLTFLNDPAFLAHQERPVPEEEPIDQEYSDDGQQVIKPEDARSRRSSRPGQRLVKKGRPKRKKGQGLLGIPQILATVVWLVLIVAIGVTAGRMIWICAADVLAFGREDRDVTITIYETDTMDQIVDKLHSSGLIRYKGLFNLYASISHAEEDIQPGIYDLNTRYDYHALVNMMSPQSSREVIKLTIPEGYSCRQIFALLEEKRICSAVDIGAYAARGDLSSYWFLEGVQRGDHYCLEGFLFPDTYQFYKNSTPKEALERLLDNFNVRFNEELRSQINNLNARFGCNYTVREIAIVASLIEKESANAEESPRIAGVIYNRLFNWQGNPAYLNIDAAIIYALNGKTDLTQEDLRTDSPYNTYTRTGLTPTPISNPGLSSLKAALNPENHNYYYYVLNPATGRHQFSTTYEEHTGYVNQFAGAQ